MKPSTAIRFFAVPSSIYVFAATGSLVVSLTWVAFMGACQVFAYVKGDSYG